jgi:hypothetical protein
MYRRGNGIGDSAATYMYDDRNRTTRSMVSVASLLELYIQIDQAIQQWQQDPTMGHQPWRWREVEVDTKMVPRALTELRSLKKQVVREVSPPQRLPTSSGVEDHLLSSLAIMASFLSPPNS